MYFVEKIAELLKIKHMNKNQLATKAGIASSTLTDLMKGRIKNPSTDLMQKIAVALDTSIDDLIGNVPGPSVSNFTQRKDGFIGENLKVLRGSRTYDEYANFLKEKGGENGVYISPYFLKRYEKGSEVPAREIIEYIADMENIKVEFFYKDIVQIAIEAMIKNRDDFNK